MIRTNVLRLLETAGLSFKVCSYDVDESDLSGISIAKKTGMNPDTVFKTLVAKGDKNGIAVFCIPVAFELDIKKAASVSGNKKLELLPLAQLLPTTGYIRGGCSPVGMKKNFPTYIDETCLLWDKIALSGGTRGLQILIAPTDIIAYCHMNVCELIV